MDRKRINGALEMLAAKVAHYEREIRTAQLETLRRCLPTGTRVLVKKGACWFPARVHARGAVSDPMAVTVELDGGGFTPLRVQVPESWRLESEGVLGVRGVQPADTESAR